jgi:hypothetical protein
VNGVELPIICLNDTSYLSLLFLRQSLETFNLFLIVFSILNFGDFEFQILVFLLNLLFLIFDLFDSPLVLLDKLFDCISLLVID